jgi:hypothetical protein
MKNNLFISLLIGSICTVNAAETQNYLPPMEAENFSHHLREVILQASPARLYEILEEAADSFKDHENFSDKDLYAQSLYNWKERCQYLKAAIALGSSKAKDIYTEELESKKYSLECYDCLIAGYEDSYDPRTVLAFYWEQVAQEIPSEQEKLALAYEQGKAIRLDQ